LLSLSENISVVSLIWLKARSNLACCWVKIRELGHML
jgi:hypothetical protein